MILLDTAGHLTSTSSLAELLATAGLAGLQAHDIQVSQRGIVHFDLWGRPLRLLRKVGVPQCSPKRIVREGLRVQRLNVDELSMIEMIAFSVAVQAALNDIRGKRLGALPLD